MGKKWGKWRRDFIDRIDDTSNSLFSTRAGDPWHLLKRHTHLAANGIPRCYSPAKTPQSRRKAHLVPWARAGVKTAGDRSGCRSSLAFAFTLANEPCARIVSAHSTPRPRATSSSSRCVSIAHRGSPTDRAHMVA
jgi:hypothetical protein